MSCWFHKNRGLYPARWREMSRKLREEIGQCEACWVRPGPGGRRLAVDHADGDQRNNRRSNLIVLCSRCHILKWHLGGRTRDEILRRLRHRLECERAQLSLFPKETE